MRKNKLLLISIFIITNLSIVNAQIYTGVFKTTTDNVDYHHFTRSHAEGAAVYINQVSTGSILKLSSGIFDANQNVKFTVENNGYVGIGTTNPSEKLDVTGRIKASLGVYATGLSNPSAWDANAVDISMDGTIGALRSRDWTANQWLPLYIQASKYIFNEGNIGIGTTNPTSNLHISSSSNPQFQIRSQYTGLRGLWLTVDDDNSMVAITSSYGAGGAYPMVFKLATSEKMRIAANGNIGIGTTDPTYKLSVKGTIGCGEIIVEVVSGWADFVFEEDYNLMPLKELGRFIQENKHLPEIPATAEVKEKGISVGEMNAKLLQKIEELTLYTIQQQELITEQIKLIEIISEEMKTQKEVNAELFQSIENLENN